MKQALIVITGPSGVGKSTLVKELMSLYGPNLMRTTVSYTTRPPRGSEKDGQQYHFVSKEQFLTLKKEDFFVEWSYVYQHYYATSKEQIEQHWQKDLAVIKDFDLTGAKNLKKMYPPCLVIFIIPPSLDILTKRLQKRSENSGEDLKLRVQQAQQEIEQSKIFDTTIQNDDLKKTTLKLKQIIDTYLSR